METAEEHEKRHHIRREEDKELFKEAMKEAAKEWLQEQFAAFGKWTAVGLLSGAFYVIVKFLVVYGAWPKG